jgi:hypothetical protein
MSATDICEAISDVRQALEVLVEGYLLRANGLAATPLTHFGKEQQQLDIPLAWAQVYSLSNLLIEGRIAPQDYGLRIWKVSSPPLQIDFCRTTRQQQNRSNRIKQA